MTLEKAAYISVMSKKKVTEEESAAHFDRIQAMMSRFNAVQDNSSLGIFGPVDVGGVVSWWDYGQLKLYQASSKLMFSECLDGKLMREFSASQDMVPKLVVMSQRTVN